MQPNKKRRRRPPPLQLAKEQDRLHVGLRDISQVASLQRSPSPTRTVSATPQETPRPQAISPDAASTFTPIPLSPTPARTSILLSPKPTSTARQSPTRTAFVTVTQPAPKPTGSKSPEVTRTVTVFLSPTAQLVTFTTIPPQVTTAPDAAQTAGSVADGVNRDATRLSPAALILLISFGAAAGLALLASAAIIVRKQRRKPKAKKEQGDMTEINEGAFQAVSDTQPILSR